jgi:hypothetical protein
VESPRRGVDFTHPVYNTLDMDALLPVRVGPTILRRMFP